MGIDFKRPRHVRGFRFGEALVWDFTSKPLVEKTVSGSIAHFDDGADEVPLKSLVVNLPASLDGYSEVDVVHEGLNQCYETDSDLFPRENGSIINSATHTAYAKVKKNTTVYITKQGNTNRQVAFGFSELPAVGVNAVQLTLTFLGNNQWSVNSGNYEYLAFYYSSEASENILFSYLQDSTYEPYEEPTTYDVDIPNPNPNLFDKTAEHDRATWNTDGSLNTDNYDHFAYRIAVEEKTAYTIDGQAFDRMIVFFDSSDNFISYVRPTMTDNKMKVTTPVGAVVMGVSMDFIGALFDTAITKDFNVYGGSIDVISGDGVSGYANASLADKNYYYSSSLQRFDCVLDGVISSGYMDDFIPPQGYTISHLLIQNAINAPDMTMCIYGGKLYLKNLSCSNVSELVSDMSGKYIVYEKATPESFSVSPIAIDSKAGTNNIWNDAGDTEVTYYAYAD